MGEGRGIVFAEEASATFEFAQEVGVRCGTFGRRGERGRCGGNMRNDFFWEGDMVVWERRVDEEEAPDPDPAGEKLARSFVGDNSTEGPAWSGC